MINSTIVDIFTFSTLDNELGFTPTSFDYACSIQNVLNSSKWYRKDVYREKGPSATQLILLYLDDKNKFRVNTTAYKDKFSGYGTYNDSSNRKLDLLVTRYDDVMPKGTILYFRKDSIFKAPKRFSPFIEANGWNDLCEYLIKDCANSRNLLSEKDFIFVPKLWDAKTKDGFYASYISDVYKIDDEISCVGSFAISISKYY